jgi:LAS superfamily LD-carboxypeptidase LdcB
MKNKSIIFFIVACIVFVLVCVLLYMFFNRNSFFKDNVGKIQDNFLPAEKKTTPEELISILEAANKNATTSPEDIANLQNALEAANKKSATQTPQNNNLQDLQTQLDAQAASEKERRDLIKTLEQANR